MKEFGWCLTMLILRVVLHHHVVLLRAARLHSKHFLVLILLHLFDVVNNEDEAADTEQYAENKHGWTNNLLLCLHVELMLWLYLFE